MLKRIIEELKHHAPFTAFGAVSGILLMASFQKIPENISYDIFYTLHPIHVLLSALVTSSMYEIHRCKGTGSKCNIWVLILIGYVGSIGIATLSDSIIPYIGETLLKMPNRHMHIGFIEEWWLINPMAFIGIGIATLSDSLIPYISEILLDMPNRHAHIGFIDKWWLINPLAVIGVGIAYYWPETKFPHAGHVLLSTWASLFHITMAIGGKITPFSYVAIFFFLFIAVWIPCCISDIVFPLLFVKNNSKNLNHTH